MNSRLLRNHRWVVRIVILLFQLPPASGHGTNPINVFLNENNQLYVGPTFDAGPLVNFDGAIFTDLPGIAALSPGNQLPNGSELGVDVLGGVWFWDGASIMPTAAQLSIRAPTTDGFGHTHESPIETYTVSSESGYQTGMRWGVYDGSLPGWDAHGMFDLTPITAPTGVYGVLLQVTSPAHLPTEPILVPFAYDPSGLGELNVTEIDNGVAALTELANRQLIPLEAGDANQDLTVDRLDLLQVLQRGKYRTSEPAAWHEGDFNAAPGGRVGLPPTGDGVFDQFDLIAVLDNGLYETGAYAGSKPRVGAVPEPDARAMLGVGLFVLLAWRVFRNVFPRNWDSIIARTGPCRRNRLPARLPGRRHRTGHRR